MQIDPSTIRLSKHFLLSDFMGNHSVFTSGYANTLDGLRGSDLDTRINNGTALCEHALEPIMEAYGPLSISYGYISPDLSRKIVHYMDPDKPSHHRWDLGAGADILVHGWIGDNDNTDTVHNAPIRLAHEIEAMGIPYSRMITYSESPYICLAVSDREVRIDRPRKAFYENRWEGKKGAKPAHLSYSTPAAKARARERLLEQGLAHGWRGQGYPSSHGGGRRQYHHIRVSKYTMLSDWLLSLQSIAIGERNMPDMRNQRLWDMIYLVGEVYDSLIDQLGVARMSIVSGYNAPSTRYFTKGNDWRSGKATFTLVPLEGMTCEQVRMSLIFNKHPNLISFGDDENYLDITVNL